jgi:hypothetical protein
MLEILFDHLLVFCFKGFYVTNMPNFNFCTLPPKILLEHYEQEGLNGSMIVCG